MVEEIRAPPSFFSQWTMSIGVPASASASRHASEQQFTVRDLLVTYYQLYNPSQLGKVDQILEAFIGDYDSMWADLFAIYGGRVPTADDVQEVRQREEARRHILKERQSTHETRRSTYEADASLSNDLASLQPFNSRASFAAASSSASPRDWLLAGADDSTADRKAPSPFKSGTTASRGALPDASMQRDMGGAEETVEATAGSTTSGGVVCASPSGRKAIESDVTSIMLQSDRNARQHMRGRRGPLDPENVPLYQLALEEDRKRRLGLPTDASQYPAAKRFFAPYGATLELHSPKTLFASDRRHRRQRRTDEAIDAEVEQRQREALYFSHGQSLIVERYGVGDDGSSAALSTAKWHPLLGTTDGFDREESMGIDGGEPLYEEAQPRRSSYETPARHRAAPVASSPSPSASGAAAFAISPSPRQQLPQRSPFRTRGPAMSGSLAQSPLVKPQDAWHRQVVNSPPAVAPPSGASPVATSDGRSVLSQFVNPAEQAQRQRDLKAKHVAESDAAAFRAMPRSPLLSKLGAAGTAGLGNWTRGPPDPASNDKPTTHLISTVRWTRAQGVAAANAVSPQWGHRAAPGGERPVTDHWTAAYDARAGLGSSRRGPDERPVNPQPHLHRFFAGTKSVHPYHLLNEPPPLSEQAGGGGTAGGDQYFSCGCGALAVLRRDGEGMIEMIADGSPGRKCATPPPPPPPPPAAPMMIARDSPAAAPRRHDVGLIGQVPIVVGPGSLRLDGVDGIPAAVATLSVGKQAEDAQVPFKTAENAVTTKVVNNDRDAPVEEPASRAAMLLPIQTDAYRPSAVAKPPGRSPFTAPVDPPPDAKTSDDGEGNYTAAPPSEWTQPLELFQRTPAVAQQQADEPLQGRPASTSANNSSVATLMPSSNAPPRRQVAFAADDATPRLVEHEVAGPEDP